MRSCKATTATKNLLCRQQRGFEFVGIIGLFRYVLALVPNFMTVSFNSVVRKQFRLTHRYSRPRVLQKHYASYASNYRSTGLALLRKSAPEVPSPGVFAPNTRSNNPSKARHYNAQTVVPWSKSIVSFLFRIPYCSGILLADLRSRFDTS